MAGQISRLRHEHVRAEEAEWRTDSPAHTGDYTTAQLRPELSVVWSRTSAMMVTTPPVHIPHMTHMGTWGHTGHRVPHHRIAMTRRKLGQLCGEGVWHEVSQGDFILKYALYTNLHFIPTGNIAPIFLPAFIRMVHVAPNYGSEVTNHKIKKYTQSRGKSSANNIPL